MFSSADVVKFSMPPWISLSIAFSGYFGQDDPENFRCSAFTSLSINSVNLCSDMRMSGAWWNFSESKSCLISRQTALRWRAFLPQDKNVEIPSCGFPQRGISRFTVNETAVQIKRLRLEHIGSNGFDACNNQELFVASEIRKCDEILY